MSPTIIIDANCDIQSNFQAKETLRFINHACGRVTSLQLGFSDSKFSDDFIPMVTRSTLKALRDQNHVLSNHLNGEVYQLMGSLLGGETGAHYLEHEPCLICDAARPKQPRAGSGGTTKGSSTAKAADSSSTSPSSNPVEKYTVQSLSSMRQAQRTTEDTLMVELKERRRY